MDDDHRWANTMLAHAVDTEPELGFRATDVLARARRDGTRRRAVLTGACTVTALAAVGLLVGREGLSRGVQAGSGSASASSTITAAPNETTVYGEEGPLVIDAHSRVLTTELAGAHPVPPGVRTSTDQTYGGRPLVFYKLITGQYVGSYLAQATLTDSHGLGHLVVQVLKTQYGLNCVGRDPRMCQTQVLPNGNRLTVLHDVSASPGGSGKRVIQWEIELVRPDGTAVDVLCGNWSMSGDPNTGGIGHASGFEPPLSKDTLVRLAQLPGLTP